MANVIDPVHLVEASSLSPLPIFLVDVKWNGFEWEADLYPGLNLVWTSVLEDDFNRVCSEIQGHEVARARSLAIDHFAKIIGQRRLRAMRLRAFFSEKVAYSERGMKIQNVRDFQLIRLESWKAFNFEHSRFAKILDYYREDGERVAVTEVVRESALYRDVSGWKLPEDAVDLGWVVSMTPPPKEYIAKFSPPPAAPLAIP